MKMFTVTDADTTRMINEGIDEFLNALEREEHISAEQYDTFKQYRCVLSEKSFWGRMWDFINFKNSDETSGNLSYMLVVKIVPPGRKKTDTNEE
jgi:hypothetical protein